MPPVYSLGIDASTQSCSAVVIDIERKVVVASESINFGAQLPQYNAPSGFIKGGGYGEVHSDPCMWLDALDMLFEKLKVTCDLSSVCAISGAGQQHGSVYLNKDWEEALSSLKTTESLASQLKSTFSRKTSPIWMDYSTEKECSEIAKFVGGSEIVCRKSGSQAIERFTGPQIRRFAKLDPSAYSQTSRIHLVSSFICSVLIGKDALIDTGDGAGMNLMNLETCDWDEELLEATAESLRDKLPSVCHGVTKAGSLHSYFSSKYGFSQNVPVAVFTGDNNSSLVGMGAATEGKLVVSLGTSDTVFAAVPASAGTIADPAGYGHTFGNPCGGLMSLQCFVNGSLAREAVKDRFGHNWEQFSEALKNTPPCNNGNIMIPFFRSEQSPKVSIDAPILDGSKAFTQWDDADACIRACVEGQVMNMKLCVDWMQLRPEVIYLTGGASQNNEIAQIVADVFQARTERLAVTSSVALGGAIRGASVCMGLKLPELETSFCTLGNAIEPRIELKEPYLNALSKFAALMASIGR